MHIKTPHSAEQQKSLIQMHRIAVSKFKRDPSTANTHATHEMFSHVIAYDNVIKFNKYAKNKCKFGNSEDAKEVCLGKFTNTFKHYCANGNCCQPCSNLFTALVANTVAQPQPGVRYLDYINN